MGCSMHSILQRGFLAIVYYQENPTTVTICLCGEGVRITYLQADRRSLGKKILKSQIILERRRTQNPQHED